MNGNTRFRGPLAVALALTALGAILTFPAQAQESTPPAPATPSGVKRRLAVRDFELGAVQNWWGENSQWEVGKGITALVEKELVKNGTFSIYTRAAKETIKDEKEINKGDAATRNTTGNLAGVGAIVRGTITQFGFDNKSKKIGGGVFGKLAGPLGGVIGGVAEKDSKAIVVITAQVVSVATGEILASAEAKGESKRKDRALLGGLVKGGSAIVGGFDMSSSDFQNTIIGEATRTCVETLVKELVKSEAKVPALKRSLLGKVADVDGETLVINIGSEQGAQVGDVLTVERILKVVKDPDTGEVIEEKTQTIGTVRLTTVRAKASTGTFTGAGAPKAGDRVRIE